MAAQKLWMGIRLVIRVPTLGLYEVIEIESCSCVSVLLAGKFYH